MNNHLALLELITNISGFSKEHILGKARHRNLVMYRQIFSFYLRTRYKYKLSDIADILRCDHTTVIYSIQRITDLIYIDDNIVLDIMNTIEAHLLIMEKNTLPKKILVTIPENKLPEHFCAHLERTYGVTCQLL